MTDHDFSPGSPEDDDALAAEHALRLLEPDAERAARARALSDPAFAVRVRDWIARLAPMADGVYPVTPSTAVRRRLMTRLFGAPERGGWLAGLRLWQGATALALAAVAVLGWQVATTGRVATLYAAELASADASLRILAVYDATAGIVRLTRTDGAAAEGRDLEIWGIAEGGAPVSIGILPDDSRTALYPVPAALAGVPAGLTLAISDEPDGGSPTGQPTGAVLAAGAVSEL